MSESGRNKDELSEGLSYKASGASATSIATRASGAELIRQLSYHKLNHYYYQSDETLNQFAGTTANSKRKSGSGSTGASSAIVKRFSDNQYDYQYGKGQHRPVATTTGGAAAARPRLLRQSTTTNSESVQGTSSSFHVGGGGQNAHNRRRQLAETREQRSWRSCDVAHHDVVAVSALSGTHLLGGSGGVRARNNSVGRSDDITTTSITPSFLDLSSSINSMNQQSAKPSPVGSNQGQLHVNNEEEDECDDDGDDDAFVVVVQQQQDQVRYTKGGIGEGADQSDEEYRVVLPPLGMGTRSLTARKNNTNTQNLVLSPQLVNAAALKTTPKNRKKIIDREEGSGTSNNKKRKKTVRRSGAPSDAASGGPKPPTSVKVAAVSAITAVAVVAVGVADKTSYPSSDESNNPRRRARGIVILTSVFLLFTCLFMVGITLRLAPLIDDLGKIKSNQQINSKIGSRQ